MLLFSNEIIDSYFRKATEGIVEPESGKCSYFPSIKSTIVFDRDGKSLLFLLQNIPISLVDSLAAV